MTIVKPICVVLKHGSHDLYTVWTRDPFLLYPWNKAVEKALKTINLFRVLNNHSYLEWPPYHLNVSILSPILQPQVTKWTPPSQANRYDRCSSATSMNRPTHSSLVPLWCPTMIQPCSLQMQEWTRYAYRWMVMPHNGRDKFSSLYELPFLSFEWVLVGRSVVEYEEVKV